MANMKRTPSQFPKDYEPCGVCNYDHTYDLPLLPARAYLEAVNLHIMEALPRTIPRDRRLA